MSFEAKMLALQARITSFDRLWRGCGNPHALQAAFIRRDRWIEKLEAMTAEYVAVKKAHNTHCREILRKQRFI